MTDGPALIALRDEVRQVRVSDEVEAYIVALVRATRDHADLELGASPRSTVALYRASQAAAVLDGSRVRAARTTSRALVQPVLAHRLVVDLDRSLRGVSAASILDAILERVPVPPLAAD